MGVFIPLIIEALQAAIKYAPTLAVEIGAVLNKGEPTAEDWRALKAKYGNKTYEQLVPNSGLTPTP